MGAEDSLFKDISDWLPCVAVAGLSLIVIAIVHLLVRVLGRKGSRGLAIAYPVLMLVLGSLGVVATVLAMPVSEAEHGNVIGLFGLVVSATIGLSATSILGNAMAGLMLRMLRHIYPGDFVRIGEHFGRVSDQGLLHTELQNEDGELITLPNLHLVTHPVTVLRSSGTVVSAYIWLSSQFPRREVERCLLAAAAKTGLTDPFVQISEIGNMAVRYRAAGFLKDVKYILSVRSQLRGHMVDTLNASRIEIVSPNVVNSREYGPGHDFLAPDSSGHESAPAESAPEPKIFEKAEAAESRSRQKEGASAEGPHGKPPKKPE